MIKGCLRNMARLEMKPRSGKDACTKLARFGGFWFPVSQDKHFTLFKTHMANYLVMSAARPKPNQGFSNLDESEEEDEISDWSKSDRGTASRTPPPVDKGKGKMPDSISPHPPAIEPIEGGPSVHPEHADSGEEEVQSPSDSKEPPRKVVVIKAGSTRKRVVPQRKLQNPTKNAMLPTSDRNSAQQNKRKRVDEAGPILETRRSKRTRSLVPKHEEEPVPLSKVNTFISVNNSFQIYLYLDRSAIVV
jgi:hypothetical protein